MNIEKITNGTTSSIKIIGRLDSVTSPEVSEKLKDYLLGVEHLILDCSELEYISSAGIRVILKAQKQMKIQGSMKMIHVNDTVMEVFDITGFSDMFDIE